MGIDFTKLGTGNPVDQVLEPRKIFTSLATKDRRYSYPRDVQTQVMEKWFARRDDRDVVIKMNTGSGKTVVGLLLLKSCMNEKKGPAVYVTPDKYLTQQVLAEASAMTLTAVEDEKDPRFLSSKAILVINIDKLVNGKSTFGVSADGVKISIGSIVIDDAHSCVARTREKFSLRLPSDHAGYKSLLALFRDELERQSPPGILDIEQDDANTAMLVPFWAWKNKQKDVVGILHPYRSDDEFKFVWPLVADVLPLCLCAFGARQVEIAPRCTPMDAINSFHSAKRRIYMTATLADDSILVTDFDAAPDLVAAVITPNSADDLGDRLILAPQELNADVDEDGLKEFLKSLASDHNVVVIVPSNKRAEMWSNCADQTLVAANIGSGVEKLKAGHVGLTVMVNKYDGVDLPDEACRILVVDGLPEVQGLLERLEQAVTEGTELSLRKQVQRIEQGMGRGVRSTDDFCVVILMGSKLTNRLHNPNGFDMLSPATQAQLRLSRQVADQLQDKSLAEIREVVELCLRRDAKWVSASKGALLSVVPPTGGTANPIAIGQRKAFDEARAQQYQMAVDTLQLSVNAETNQRVKGWLKQQVAEYKHHDDPVEAQRILLSAVRMNRQVLRPVEGISYPRLEGAAGDQAATAVEYYRARYIGPNDLIISVNAMLEDLVFQPDKAKDFEAAILEVGLLLGFKAQRPENDQGKGPDDLWAVGGLKYYVIECKNGVIKGKVNKHDCNQLAGSMNWFKETYDGTCTGVPVLVHVSNVFEKAATPHPGTRVMTPEGLNPLKDALRGLAKGLTVPGAITNPLKVMELLRHFKLTAADLIETFTVQSVMSL